MSTNSWGVADGYHDISGQWHATPPETRHAIHTGMGVEGANSVPPRPAVRVLESGAETAWSEPGQLLLEDGRWRPIKDKLPADLPWGYHTFHPDRGGPELHLIVTPGRCEPPRQTWGWSVQLYATRSQQSWGMGDLDDLSRLGRWAAGQGAGLLLVSPLCAASPLPPQPNSPYSPSSRRFLNPLYLRIEAVPGVDRLGRETIERLATVGRALNADPRIDRDAVLRIKGEALKRIWEQFSGEPEFDRFCRLRGDELHQFATHCALSQFLGEGDWRQWPGGYRRPEGEAVRRFAEEHARDVQHHQWLQWLLDRQLAAAADSLPLVQDLPIGVAPGGADAWAWQDLLAMNCSVGAPPDSFNSSGQDWGVPPLVPWKLRQAAYRPFVQTLRASLRHARGLRIDHVMGLFRLFWIPTGLGPDRGAYVRYPADELLGIVALESRRANAFVVGEDLGTVEAGVREQLAARRMLSFRVLWFEDRPPKDYPSEAMAAVSTHDLPTVAGLWTGKDLEAQQSLGHANVEGMRQMRDRLAAKIHKDIDEPIDHVIEATYRVLGEAPSLVLLATLDDAAASTERPNMPGTTTEWPSWCIPLPGGMEALEAGDLPDRIARALGRGAESTNGQAAAGHNGQGAAETVSREDTTSRRP